MLFMAVFCGFLAELQLEHYIEHQREKKYIERVYRDLKKDTSFYSEFKNNLSKTYQLMDSMVIQLHTGDYQKDPDLFYKMSLRARGARYFEYYNTAFEQMKTSGNLRLIRNEQLIDSLVSYYYLLDKRVSVIDQRHLEIVSSLNNALYSFIDAGYYVTKGSYDDGIGLSNSFSIQNAKFPVVPEAVKLQLKNMCFHRKANLKSQVTFLLQLQKKANGLLQQIEKEYSVK